MDVILGFGLNILLGGIVLTLGNVTRPFLSEYYGAVEKSRSFIDS